MNQRTISKFQKHGGELEKDGMGFISIINNVVAMVGNPRPIILYHQPTLRCDCKCRFCDSWIDQPKEDDSPAAEDFGKVIDRAALAGMIHYTAWGGEPLMAGDLPAYLARSKRVGMTTTICTSGYCLAERAEEISPHIDKILLSVEAVGERQDRIRRTPGLFERIEAGLEEVRKLSKCEVILWSNISSDTVSQVEAIARFAKDHEIGVEFFPATVYPDYNESLILTHDLRKEVFDRIIELKKERFPVLNTMYALKLMRSGKPFKCNMAKIAVQVLPDGMFYACDPKILPDLEPYGDVEKTDLGALRYSKEYHENIEKLASCNACLLPCVASMANSLTAQALARLGDRIFYAPSSGH